MAKEITLILHRNILGDLPTKLRAYAAKLEQQPKLRGDVLACADVVDGWLKTPGDKLRCTRSKDSWEWLCEVCKSMKAWASATIIELKVDAWFKERAQAENARELHEARVALEAEEAQ